LSMRIGLPVGTSNRHTHARCLRQHDRRARGRVGPDQGLFAARLGMPDEQSDGALGHVEAGGAARRNHAGPGCDARRQHRARPRAHPPRGTVWPTACHQGRALPSRCSRSPHSAGSLAQDLVHQPTGTGEQGDLAPRPRGRDLAQRRRRDPPRRSDPERHPRRWQSGERRYLSEGSMALLHPDRDSGSVAALESGE